MIIWMWIPLTVSLSVNSVEPANTETAGVKDARIAARTRTVAPIAVSFRTFHVSFRNAAARSPADPERDTGDMRGVRNRPDGGCNGIQRRQRVDPEIAGDPAEALDGGGMGPRAPDRNGGEPEERSDEEISVRRFGRILPCPHERVRQEDEHDGPDREAQDHREFVRRSDDRTRAAGAFERVGQQEQSGVGEGEAERPDPPHVHQDLESEAVPRRIFHVRVAARRDPHERAQDGGPEGRREAEERDETQAHLDWTG